MWESPTSGEDGRCPAHRPGARERLQAAGRKGAETAARKLKGAAGLDPDELPSLRTPQDAEAWLETVGQAVATGKLANRDGQVVVQAVRE